MNNATKNKQKICVLKENILFCGKIWQPLVLLEISVGLWQADRFGIGLWFGSPADLTRRRAGGIVTSEGLESLHPRFHCLHPRHIARIWSWLESNETHRCALVPAWAHIGWDRTGGHTGQRTPCTHCAGYIAPGSPMPGSCGHAGSCRCCAESAIV